MSNSTFTFKTRRKNLLLICLLVIVQGVASQPIQCPEPCECYVNNNGIPSARCSELSPDQQAFPNIHVLVLRPSEDKNECKIPKNIDQVLPQLNFLYMMNCSLTSISNDIFKDLHSLQEVDLSNNYIKELDSSVFMNNEKLSYANLQNNRFHIADRPFLISKSLKELVLTSCGIREIPFNMFKNLTHVKYLTLSDNKLRTIDENTLPSGLRTLNLAKNHIKNVPTAELLRLKHIREIDLSENPVNCTCSLIEFQNLVSGKGVVFQNGIQCKLPREYSGQRLMDLPQYELCDAVIESRTECGDDEICNNQISPEEGTTKKNDYVMDVFEEDQVVPVDKKRVVDFVDEMQSDSADEGSGDSSTDIPEVAEEKPKSTEPSTDNAQGNETSEPIIPPETKISEAEQTGPTSSEAPKPPEEVTPVQESVTEKKNDVTSYKNEIATSDNATEKRETDEEESATEAIVSKPQPDTESPANESTSANNEPTVKNVSEAAETTPEKPVTHDNIEAETVKPPNENKTVEPPGELIAGQNPNDSSLFNLGYIIPCLAILAVIIICFGVYLGQRSSHKKNWDPEEANTNNGIELQDASLISGKSKTTIVKKSKYPSEGNSEQTEGLMGSPTPADSVWQHLEEPIENGKGKHVDGNQLPNGQSNGKNEPIECAIVKVTTLPDSVPRTPVIRNT